MSEVSSGIYELDVAHSHIGFKIKHLAISTVKGKFDKFQGAGKLVAEGFKLSDISLKIEANSINANEPKRDTYLRLGYFF